MADTHQLSMFIVVIATEQCTVAVIQYLPDGGQALSFLHKYFNLPPRY
ncbi:hypothetical protein [Photorhabdus sp. RM96S]